MKKLLFLSFTAFWISSCNFFDSSDAVPMILDISEAQLVTEIEQGANTHAITDAWVYVDGFSVGVYQLPAQVPILSENEKAEIVLFAGVRKNGIQNDPIEYPFYDRIDISLDFEPGQTKDITPEFRYQEDVIFEVIEGFEVGHIFSDDVDSDPNSYIALSSAEAASGSSSGLLKLDSTATELEASIQEYLKVSDIGNGNIFLEMDYKNDLEFQIGLLTVIGNLELKEYAIILKQSEEWNKIYIDVGRGFTGGVEFYKPLIGTINTSMEEKFIYVDNIKLLHF